MSLDDIWDVPIASPPKSLHASPLKRPRQSLFLPDSDSDYERPPKRATPAPPPARPDVDALFDDLDKVEEVDDLTYKPLAPTLDLAKLAKEAEQRHAHARQTDPSQTLASTPNTASDTGKNQSEKGQERDMFADGEKKGRKVLPKLNEERLIGPEGFPLLIEEIRGFKPKGKGSEHADLNRLLQVYQFWAHRMYPKHSFKDTIDRVEKLCHSKRMQVRLSVWHDEFKGITNDRKSAEDPDVIDLTEPALVGTEDNEADNESLDLQSKSNQASSPPSPPPASSEVDDDHFDIDAVIRAEEERLAAFRAKTANSGAPTSQSLAMPEKAPPHNGTDTHEMDLDEACLWDAVDGPQVLPGQLKSHLPPSVPQDGDDEMWDVINEIEQGESSKPRAEVQIPISRGNPIPSSDSSPAPRATNDEGWEEMYS